MTSILVLGGSGRTGKLVIDYSLARGHSVTALVRDPAKVVPRQGLTVVKGTPLSATDVGSAIEGTNAVVSMLGNSRTSDMPWAKQVSPPRFMADATENAVAAMEGAGVRRIVVVSALGVGDSMDVSPRLLKWVVEHTNLGTTYADHNLLDAALRSTDTDWTLVRPALLSNSAKPETIEVRHVPDKPAGWSITRESVATFTVDAISDDSLIKTAPMISGKRA